MPRGRQLQGNRMKMTALLAAAASLLLLSACADVKPKPISPATGLFPTNTPLDTDGVRTEKPFEAKYRHLVYLKVPDDKPTAFVDFFMTELRNSKIFDKVAAKSDLEAIVIQKNLSDKVPSVSDMVGLHKLESAIGPFLVVEPTVEWKGGYHYTGQLKVVDPETGETVLLLQQKAFNWAGLDSPLVYPLLNGLLEWARGQAIATGGGAPVAKSGS